MPDSYPTTPSSTDAATSESKEANVTLQPSQQQPTLPAPPALGEIAQELQSPTGEGGNSAQLLMPVEPVELGTTRPSGEGETTQMELSPAPTISEYSFKVLSGGSSGGENRYLCSFSFLSYFREIVKTQVSPQIVES